MKTLTYEYQNYQIDFDVFTKTENTHIWVFRKDRNFVLVEDILNPTRKEICNIFKKYSP